MDVEGFEINVLRGAQGFLEKCNFPPIMFEAWDKSFYESGRLVLMKEFLRLGYVVNQITKDDYVAQHPLNLVRVDIVAGADGSIQCYRSR